ncbi:MAG: HAD family hydrolase [Candidatus Azambacteria bacterium]|nr:HAD family hydrolase [Candidatus Azambacteria bacterium]
MIIIFDCDGVLRSASWEGLYKAYIKLIEAQGKEPYDFFTDMKSFKLWWNPDWHRNNEKLGLPLYKTDEIDTIFHEVYDSYIHLFDWVPEIICELYCKHLLALLTSSAESSVRKFLDGSNKYFDCIVGCERVKKLKPHPEGIHKIMRNFPEVSEEEFILVGDMTVDIQAGKNAGIRTGAVSWGFGEKEELLSLSPDMFFAAPQDLLKIGKEGANNGKRGC